MAVAVSVLEAEAESEAAAAEVTPLDEAPMLGTQSMSSQPISVTVCRAGAVARLIAYHASELPG